MAGLVPAIHGLFDRGMRYGGFVYIMTNRPNGTLYVGVTNDIARRAYEHREGLAGGFTERHGLKRLVWYEPHESIGSAIQRETSMKRWPRAYKIRVIMDMNPDWADLYETLLA
jgi:putative endonuclease